MVELKQFVYGKVIRDSRDIPGYRVVANSKGIQDNVMGACYDAAIKNIGNIYDYEGFDGAFALYSYDASTKVIAKYFKSPVIDPRRGTHFLQIHFVFIPEGDYKKLHYMPGRIINSIPSPKHFEDLESIPPLVIDENVNMSDEIEKTRLLLLEDDDSPSLSQLLRAILYDKPVIIQLDGTPYKAEEVITGALCALPPNIRRDITFIWNPHDILNCEFKLKVIKKTRRCNSNHTHVNLSKKVVLGLPSQYECLYADFIVKKLQSGNAGRYVIESNIFQSVPLNIDTNTFLNERIIVQEKLRFPSEAHDISTIDEYMSLVHESPIDHQRFWSNEEIAKELFNLLLTIAEEEKNLKGFNEPNKALIIDLAQRNEYVNDILTSYWNKVTLLCFVRDIGVSEKSLVDHIFEGFSGSTKSWEHVEILKFILNNPSTMLSQHREETESFLNIYYHAVSAIFGNSLDEDEIFQELDDPLLYTRFVNFYLYMNREKDHINENQLRSFIDRLMSIPNKVDVNENVRNILIGLRRFKNRTVKKMKNELAEAYQMEEFLVPSLPDIFASRDIRTVKKELPNYIFSVGNKLNSKEIIAELRDSKHRDKQREIYHFILKIADPEVNVDDILEELDNSAKDIQELVENVGRYSQGKIDDKILSILHMVCESQEDENDTARILWNLNYKLPESINLRMLIRQSNCFNRSERGKIKQAIKISGIGGFMGTQGNNRLHGLFPYIFNTNSFVPAEGIEPNDRKSFFTRIISNKIAYFLIILSFVISLWFIRVSKQSAMEAVYKDGWSPPQKVIVSKPLVIIKADVPVENVSTDKKIEDETTPVQQKNEQKDIGKGRRERAKK